MAPQPASYARRLFLEALLLDFTPELARVGTACRKALLEIGSERIDLAWEDAVLAFRKDSGGDPSLHGPQAETNACCRFSLAFATARDQRSSVHPSRSTPPPALHQKCARTQIITHATGHAIVRAAFPRNTDSTNVLCSSVNS